MSDARIGAAKKVVPGQLDVWGGVKTLQVPIDADTRDGGRDGGEDSTQLKPGLVLAKLIPRDASITHGTFAVAATYTFDGVAIADPQTHSANDVYFNPTTNLFRLSDGTDWSDTTLAVITDNSAAVGVGIGSGDPAPVVIDSEAEVAAYFAENGFVDSNLYVYYDEAASEVRTATGYTAAVLSDAYIDYDADADTGAHLEENSVVLLDVIPDISAETQWATVLVSGVLNRNELRFRTAADKTVFEFGKAPFHSI